MDSPRRSRNRAACRRCQRRKIRCDGVLPQCASCKKANVACVNDGKQEVNRSYIANLQKRVQWLESLVREEGTTADLEDGPPDSMDLSRLEPTYEENHTSISLNSPPCQNGQRQGPMEDPQPPRTSRQAHEIGLVSLSSGGEPRYIGPSSGYFLANLVFSSAGRRTGPAGNHGGSNDPISLSAELFNSPASLPNKKEDAVELSSKYFTSVHFLYPFLHEPSHMQRLESMYTDADPHPSVAFHVYMVLAIAASDLSRRFRLRLPAEGYYTAATQHFERACAEGSLEGLQSLLLLMVYALHNPSCGINIWSLNYQCLGALIDLGLQRDVRASPAFPISFLEQEMRTRIFWVVYNFDRTLGTMMGRPIGVRDEACELRLPFDIADQYLAESAVQERTGESPPSHMTYSIHLFKLARINSEIKYVMHSISRNPPRYAYPPVVDIYQWQKDMIDNLGSWLADIPRSAGMQSIAKICENKYHEMMILILRPSPGIPEPSDNALAKCFQHTVELLRGFGDLYRQEAMLYSRLVVHSIFLSALIMLHMIWRLPQIASQVHIDDLVADTGISLNILSSIGEYWAEARRARDCIHELSGATIQRLIKLRSLDKSPRATRTQRAGVAQTPQSSTANELSDQVDSAVDITPSMTSLMDDCGFNMDGTSWLNDSISGGFMDFAGVPDFDSLMWEVFNST
ncbi:hypothetical protein N7532_008007 [Penicillium argentinense]|uniref:Zn(2)-C6 fungal-type domain-containing protein n=1 Tax=Penicillium argentinense TaxID=1131581 RepID=A0A9W9K171_9EURO|nr:uncharacterized protein N7532_008007 [Penicillium argentinense]KAJ5089323.1 hypothetical protein N7532_008007 [Penicillium argentinense]